MGRNMKGILLWTKNWPTLSWMCAKCPQTSLILCQPRQCVEMIFMRVCKYCRPPPSIPPYLPLSPPTSLCPPSLLFTLPLSLSPLSPSLPPFVSLYLLLTLPMTFSFHFHPPSYDPLSLSLSPSLYLLLPPSSSSSLSLPSPSC